MIKLISFGFKFGAPQGTPVEVRLLDCRVFSNPHFIASLRVKTGIDAEVQHYMRRDPKFLRTLRLVTAETRDGARIAAGCVGGKHRSVALIELLAKGLVGRGFEVMVLHRELNQQKTLSP